MLNETEVQKVIYSNSGIKFNDLSKLANIGRHERKELRKFLRNLERKSLIIYSDKKYFKGLIVSEKGRFDALALMKGHQFGFVITESDHIMINLEDTLGSFHNDIVEVQVTGAKRKGKVGKIIRIIERGRGVLVGTVAKLGNQAMLTGIGGHFHRDAQITNPEIANAGDKVVASVSFWGDLELYPRVKITEVLGRSGDIQTEILSVIHSYELPLEFKDELVKEAENLSKNFDIEEDIKGRKDLRGLHTFTIDPASAKDFDDAVSVKVNTNGEYELFVHIADVSHFVKPGSSLFAEALSRGNSYYFPKRVIPMLPKIISNSLCSLRPDEDKYTITVRSVFDKNFEILEQSVFKSVIRSNVRFNYEQVDEIFEKGILEGVAKEDKDALLLADRLSKGYFKKRKKYIQFSLPETEFEFDEDGQPINLLRSQETDSHKLIENFMLIANEYVAKFLSSKTSIYRVHEPPEYADIQKVKKELEQNNVEVPAYKNSTEFYQRTLERLDSDDEKRTFERKILRSMKRAEYSLKNSHHFGIGIDFYTHFTSPIRRICDLGIHLLLKNEIKSDKVLKKIVQNANEKEQIATNAENDVQKLYYLQFMKKRLGNEYKATIVDIKRNVVKLELVKYPVFVSVLCENNALRNKKFKLTKRMLVKIVKVDREVEAQFI